MSRCGGVLAGVLTGVLALAAVATGCVVNPEKRDAIERFEKFEVVVDLDVTHRLVDEGTWVYRVTMTVTEEASAEELTAIIDAASALESETGDEVSLLLRRENLDEGEGGRLAAGTPDGVTARDIADTFLTLEEAVGTEEEWSVDVHARVRVFLVDRGDRDPGAQPEDAGEAVHGAEAVSAFVTRIQADPALLAVPRWSLDGFSRLQTEIGLTPEVSELWQALAASVTVDGPVVEVDLQPRNLVESSNADAPTGSIRVEAALRVPGVEDGDPVLFDDHSAQLSPVIHAHLDLLRDIPHVAYVARAHRTTVAAVTAGQPLHDAGDEAQRPWIEDAHAYFNRDFNPGRP